MQHDRQLDKLDEELSIEIYKSKDEETEGALVVKVTLQRTLVFTEQVHSRAYHLKDNVRDAERQTAIV